MSWINALKTMFGYIYETANLIDGRKYVGQRHGEFDPSYFGSGRKIREAVVKLGRSNFSVKLVESACDQKQLDSLEKHYIKIAKSNPVGCYNIMDGGFIGGCPIRRGFKITEEHRDRLRISHLGKTHSVSKETREKIRIALLGKKRNLPKESRERMSMIATERGKSPAGLSHIRKIQRMRRYIIDDELLKRLADARSRNKYKPTESHVKKMIAGRLAWLERRKNNSLASVSPAKASVVSVLKPADEISDGE